MEIIAILHAIDEYPDRLERVTTLHEVKPGETVSDLAKRLMVLPNGIQMNTGHIELKIVKQ